MFLFFCLKKMGIDSPLLEVIKTKGLDNVTVEELVADITPKGRCK